MLLSCLLLATALHAAAAVQDPPYAMLQPDVSTGKAFGIQAITCADGEARPMISTLIMGESKMGVLRSPAFDAPEKLRFWLAGHARRGHNHVRLVTVDGGETLASAPVPGSTSGQRITWDLSAHTGKPVVLEILDDDPGSGWAWIALGGVDPAVVALPGDPGESLPEGWTEEAPPATTVTVDGIPFLKGLAAPFREEGGDRILDIGPVQASHLYLLGGVAEPDVANPAWGGGDSRLNLFAGDEAGAIALEYASGDRDRVPLIYGYTLWWRGPYRQSPAPFSAAPGTRAILDRALCVANGVDGYQAEGPEYYLAIALRDEPLARVHLINNVEKAGCPAIEGITLRLAADTRIAPGDAFQAAQGTDIPEDTRVWLGNHTIDGRDPYPVLRQAAVAELRQRLYTFAEDITHEQIEACGPAAAAANYTGPRIRFGGTPGAEILSQVFLDSVAELRARVDPDGMVHESRKGAENYGGFGGYTPGLGPFYGSAYTRNRSLANLSRLGFEEESQRITAFFDKWLLHFPNSFPEVQLDGKPVPGHATVIANKPHVYFDELRKVGWPTKYTTRDFGNPETDGHGILMLGRWLTWVKAGRRPEWVHAHWEALREAAEFIPWALDHPELSFSEHGLLYAESEGGMQIASLYANLPCYCGLLAYAEMAESAGKKDVAQRWRGQADRLFAAMEAHFPKEDETWGNVWDPAKAAGWGYRQGVLAPLVLGTDFWGFLAAERMPPPWRGRTERSYEMALTFLKPEWCAPAGFGYGQCYFAQAALLLDRIQDAEHLINWLARFCFAPRQIHPYRVPEGVTMATDGSVWRRWGDLGNLYQMNEATHSTVIMAGIDDTRTEELLIVPRLPKSWRELEVMDYPVTAKSKGVIQTVSIGYRLRNDAGKGAAIFECTTSAPLDHARVRIGPFSASHTAAKVENGGHRQTLPLVQTGDSAWLWLPLSADGTQHHILVRTG